MTTRCLLYILGITLGTIACQTGPVSGEQHASMDVSDQAVLDTVVPVKTDSVPTLNTDVDINYLMGKFVPKEHPDFVEIDTMHADRPGLFLRKETYTAFIRMYNAAQKDGIRLQIRSATRTFGAQKYIWERKWTGETTIENGKLAHEAYPDPSTRAAMILRYSSMPGSSRHHWGTDIDLNAFNNSWFESGAGLEIYNWLTKHAGEFGFCQPYSAKGSLREHGYEEERWHWSYMPLSQPMTEMAAKHLRDAMISGFEGAQVAPDLKIIERYVLGINPDCLK